jgi:hypothetical protein
MRAKLLNIEAIAPDENFWLCLPEVLLPICLWQFGTSGG